jgi:hypothetical protein
MSGSPLAVGSPLAAGSPLPALVLQPDLPIARPVSASADEAVQRLEDRSFMTGLARRICDWEDAGGAWKVASYALHAIFYAVGYLTIVGNLAFIWLSREVGRVDSENALLRDGRLANPSEIQRLQAQIQQHAAQPAANAEELVRLQQDLQAERTNLGQTAERLTVATAQVTTLQQQITTLEGEVGKWEKECDELENEVNFHDVMNKVQKFGPQENLIASLQKPQTVQVNATPLTKFDLHVQRGPIEKARKALLAKIEAFTPERRAELIELFQNAGKGKSEVPKDTKENKDNKSA